MKADKLTIFRNINSEAGRNNLKEVKHNLSTSSKESTMHHERFTFGIRKCLRATAMSQYYTLSRQMLASSLLGLGPG